METIFRLVVIQMKLPKDQIMFIKVLYMILMEYKN